MTLTILCSECSRDNPQTPACQTAARDYKVETLPNNISSHGENATNAFQYIRWKWELIIKVLSHVQEASLGKERFVSSVRSLITTNTCNTMKRLSYIMFVSWLEVYQHWRMCSAVSLQNSGRIIWLPGLVAEQVVLYSSSLLLKLSEVKERHSREETNRCMKTMLWQDVSTQFWLSWFYCQHL